ncbi:LytR/AlgR family response regulator transcription factor [Spirosoma areae]
MKKSYRVVVLDDEPPARELTELFVNRMPDLTCVATCSNAMQGLEAIQQLKPDLLFLDIEMPEMTGLELISLPITPRPEIILTTAYPQYALSSYEFSVLDYLVKPISFERFVKAIVKFREKRQGNAPVSTAGDSTDPMLAVSPPDDLPAPPVTDTASVWLREEKHLLQIPYDDILYVEGLKDYVKVFLRDQMIMSHMSIGKAEKLFTPPQFVRVHRSYIVPLSAIRRINGNTITLTNGTQLLIGPNYRQQLSKYIAALG